MIPNFSDPGEPLGETDFFLATQLPIIPHNTTTEELMRIIAIGELEGANKENERRPRSGLEPIM